MPLRGPYEKTPLQPYVEARSKNPWEKGRKKAVRAGFEVVSRLEPGPRRVQKPRRHVAERLERAAHLLARADVAAVAPRLAYYQLVARPDRGTVATAHLASTRRGEQ